MQDLPPLDGLSHQEKDALIRALWQELQQLRAEVEKLKQKRVKKTSRNSSVPPSKGFRRILGKKIPPSRGAGPAPLGSALYKQVILFQEISLSRIRSHPKSAGLKFPRPVRDRADGN
jgi:hypothetical protein